MHPTTRLFSMTTAGANQILSPRRFLNVNEVCNFIYIVAFSLVNLLLKLPGSDFVVGLSLTPENIMPPTEPLVFSLYALQLFPL